MRIFLLVTCAMLAFAANSILNRAALAGGEIGPAAFAAIRVVSGAVVLALIAYMRGSLRLPNSLIGPLGLVLYMFAFSFSYFTLDAGFGALLLFGTVQVAMFLTSILRGGRPKALEYIGSVLAFSGLIYLVWPSLSIGGVLPTFLMVLAGIGWAMFTVAGQSESEPLSATAAALIAISPLALLVWWIAPAGPMTNHGILLAMISGIVTSGLGYTIWYAALPKLAITTAAIVQLTVPIIAIILAALLLSEPMTLRTSFAAIIVIFGVSLSIWVRNRSK